MRKHLLLFITLLLTGLTSWAQSLNIGGHYAALDTINNMWLCSVPQSLFGNDFTATVNYGDEVSDFAIDSVAVASGEEFTFLSMNGGTRYAVTCQMGDSLFTGYITFTWLPVLEISCALDNAYQYGTIYVSEPDSALAQPLPVKMKMRGGATNTPDKNKRNFRLNFINEDSTKCNRRFLGLRKDNSWILDAGQMDFLRVRNRVSTDLWLDMARRPWYADTLPNAHNGSRGKMVEVILNGGYNGIYNMCEPIDRKQMKAKKYDEVNREYHGQLWTGYKWTRTVCMSDPSPVPVHNYIWDGFEVTYPDWKDIHRANWTTLSDAVFFAGRADWDKRLLSDSIQDYFDIPVMQDYFIFIVALQALDNESKNIYYVCHDRTENRRLTMVPWDLDVCLGANFKPSSNYPNMVKPDRPLDWITHLPMYDLFFSVKTYHNEVLERYSELRKTWLDTENLVKRYRDAITELQECGAASREEARWSGDTDLARKELNLGNEMDYVENWIRQRMEYLDEFVFIPLEEFPKGDVNGDGEVTIADVNADITIILGAKYDDAMMERADVNEDGEITVSDINEIIKIIMNNPS